MDNKTSYPNMEYANFFGKKVRNAYLKQRKKNTITPLLLEVYATPPRESRDRHQPIANFRCISIAPEELKLVVNSDSISFQEKNKELLARKKERKKEKHYFYFANVYINPRTDALRAITRHKKKQRNSKLLELKNPKDISCDGELRLSLWASVQILYYYTSHHIATPSANCKKKKSKLLARFKYNPKRTVECKGLKTRTAKVQFKCLLTKFPVENRHQ
ncbi:hypothetical protein WN51_03974 [Melipona quadrifasciata]|uniref:Uncharacterized protein n=1 Tax=Melipona quadrifasciata TaxID=166423 RepID=A0A0N0BC66_9HYME|nr:hypothetical protein WN51_03974 [Melipona quadrifasciata]